MYAIVRMIIGLLIFFGLTLLLKRGKATVKYIVSFVVAVVVTVALIFLPFENLFFRFSAPDKAVGYFELKKRESYFVIEGDRCDLVAGVDNNTQSLLIVPKDSSGWKVGIGANTKKGLYKIKDDIVVQVYYHSKLEEYFVYVHDFECKALNVSDSGNSQFTAIKLSGESDERYAYCAYVSDYNSQYQLNVDGIVIETGN